MNYRLIKCVSILLILILIMGIFAIFPTNKVEAKSQKRTYTKGSSILDDYPGYSNLLDNLLEEHPNWTFTILYTGLDWDDVIKNETTVSHGRSMIQGRDGAWLCSTCESEGKTYYDGSWKCASAAAVSYYMDPRNFLYDESRIFQFENLGWSDNVFTIDGIEAILDGCDYMLQDKITYTTTAGKKATINKTYAEVIMEAAEKTGVSPYHIASRIRQEQGTGSSASPTATGTVSGYKGYYNFFNINANGDDEITRALEYAKSKGWTDPEKAIVGGAEFLAGEYLDFGQNTLYLQKFDVDDSDGDLYSHQYMENIEAPSSECSTTFEAYKEVDEDLDIPFNFIIPVYEDMPVTKSPMPGTESIVTQNIQVTDASIYVYKEKNTSSTKLATLKKGDKVLRIEIDSKKTNGKVWSKVVLDNGTKGYVVNTGFKQIADVTNCNIEAIAVEPGRLRNGPGTSGTESLLVLTVGQKVTIIEKGKYNNISGENWTRIVLADGTQGYIVSRYLEEVDNSGSTPSGADIVKVVCPEGLTIRKSPGTSSDILGYADEGDYLTRLEKNVSTKNGYTWDKVVTESGITGYVARGDDDEDYIQSVNGPDIKEDGFESSGALLLCEPDITVSNLTSKLSGATVKKSNGDKVTSGNAATGYTVTYNGITYIVTKLGDVTCDGIIDSADLLAIKKHLLGKTKLEDVDMFKAADATNDGIVDSADLLAVKKYLLKKGNLSI